ncbi:sensor histidine kinase [Cohnella silvisoli]|uniref:Histidine kinase n=1 Tax=Cohnella silvisoli TaxID=2873699 RepID=A0ABV1KLN2_9BACL|nr:histidine kinase [Cohnella silvisoli]MCD9020659.1 histidine kinase [Cohnella silvisoli]
MSFSLGLKDVFIIQIHSAMRRMTIFPKLVLTFLVAIVPLFVVSLQLNRMGAESVRKEIWGSMETRIRFNMGSLESEMDRLLRLHKQYALDEDVTKLSMMSSILPYYEVMLLHKRVQNKLWIMENASLYISEARAYIPLIGKTLLSLSTEEGMTEEEERELQNLNRSQASPVVYWQGKLLLNTIYPDPSTSAKPPIYILQSEMDQRGLQSFLRNMTGVGGGGSLLFNDNQKWMLESGPGSTTINDQVRAFVKRQPVDQHFGQGKITVDSRSYYVTFERSGLLNMYLALYMPEEQVLGPLDKYQTWFWILSALSLAVVIGFSYWIFRLIHSPLRSMVRAFRKVEKGDLTVAIAHRNYDEFQYLYRQFNIMVSRLQQSVQDVYESKIMAQQSELKQLQSQINPHFLYNTYYMVHRMAGAHDVDNVAKATKYLGDYFIYITRNSSDAALLEEEWNHTIAYLEIQQMRFQNRIEASISCQSTRLRSVRIPRLILQPIVENAYQHGLQSKKSGGMIALSIQDSEEEEAIVISVEENGEGLSDEELHRLQQKLESVMEGSFEKTGMMNVHQRLRLKFGEPWGMRVSKSALGGLKIALYIPLGKSTNAEE